MAVQQNRDVAGESLRTGPLARAGGFAILEGLPDLQVLYALMDEAQTNYSLAHRQVTHQRDWGDSRNCVPARALTTGPGGSVQDALYASGCLHSYLSELCGNAVRPTGARGSYSYYTEQGDFLDTHRDIHQCDLTLITVLHDDTPPNDPGGGLALFPQCTETALGDVHQLSDSAASFHKLQPGDSVVLLGGLVPHRVSCLGERGQRVISALCFEAIPS